MFWCRESNRIYNRTGNTDRSTPIEKSRCSTHEVQQGQTTAVLFIIGKQRIYAANLTSYTRGFRHNYNTLKISISIHSGFRARLIIVALFVCPLSVSFVSLSFSDHKTNLLLTYASVLTFF